MFDIVKQQLNMQEIMSAGDEDGNTVLHLAVARKQIQTVKVVPQEAVLNVNVTNKSGLTALDVSDVILQIVGSGELTDYMLRDLLLHAGALKASEFAGTIETAQVLLHHPAIVERAISPPQILDHFLQYLLQKISLLNP
ncbi:hypothetical protein FH972_014376 [Carpinus fangiana]|uniref:Uncharacterized protein n=1 Tax=Carpinus fangiana TaxID=176857 RepID=A0A5N6R9T0_9ROSI|nr:hypothetical protein FH972_014376 [Carpinus fangiana]